jgi:diguanylate cyclase
MREAGMSSSAEESAPARPGAEVTDQARATVSCEPTGLDLTSSDLAIAGVNPALASAFAAIAALVASGDSHPASLAVTAARRAAVSRAAARLDGSLAVLAEARRALSGDAPAAAVATAEAECRRLSRDLALYFPSLTSLDEAAESLPGRREFEAVIERLCGVARSKGRASSIMLIGVDRLSRLDAAHGEGASADVLAAVGRAMAASLSGVARVFRFDLDVYAAVLPDMPLRQAVAVAEHLRRSVMDRRLVRRSSGALLGRITLSAGVVSTIADGDPGAAVDRAVRCLGEAQWHGGNRVVCETDPAFDQTLRAIA